MKYVNMYIAEICHDFKMYQPIFRLSEVVGPCEIPEGPGTGSVGKRIQVEYYMPVKYLE